MGDMGKFWRDVNNAKKAFRREHGKPCPRCTEIQPKRSASILLPGQVCKFDGFKDPRKRIQWVDTKPKED